MCYKHGKLFFELSVVLSLQSVRNSIFSNTCHKNIGMSGVYLPNRDILVCYSIGTPVEKELHLRSAGSRRYSLRTVGADSD